MPMLLTPKQVAQTAGLSESTIKRWCDQGLLATVRTAGGHRRLAIPEVVQYLRRSGIQLVRPEILGLPSNAGQGATVLSRAQEQLRQALLAGDEEQCRRIVFDLYLSGQSACEICDRVMANAFHQIGLGWERGEVDVYRERLGCEIAMKVLHELMLVLAPRPRNAPLALGGTLEHDPYGLPTRMVELALREAGWRATSLGTQLPASTLAEAIREKRPRLLWLSISSVASLPQFLADYETLRTIAEKQGVAVVVGGRALTGEVRQQMTFSCYGDSLRHLVTFAATLTAVRQSNADELSAATQVAESHDAP